MEVKSKQAAQEAVKRGAELCALLGAAIARKNKEVLAVEQRHEPTITTLSAELAGIKAALKPWAEANRAEFAGTQTLKMPAGALVFRMGGRALDLLPRWTWKKVLAAMVRWKAYLRPKVEINKQKILADSAGDKPKLTPDRLKKVGLRVIQEESFDVEFYVSAKLGTAAQK